MRKGNTCWYTEILNSMPIKMCTQLETHHNMIQNQANQWFITKSACLATFDNLLHLLKSAVVFINNYGQRIWSIHTVFNIPNSLLPFMLCANVRTSYDQPSHSVIQTADIKWARLHHFDPNSFDNISVRIYLKMFQRVQNFKISIYIYSMCEKHRWRVRQRQTNSRIPGISAWPTGWGKTNLLPQKTHTL